MSKHSRTLITWALLGLMTSGSALAGDTFATIDGEAISYEEFDRFVHSESRQTFYHGAPLDEQGMIEFRRESADKLIDFKLKIREARRRGLSIDASVIDSQLTDYEARYGDTERWQAEGEAMTAAVRTWLEDRSLLQQIDEVLREVAEPGDDELRKFYDANLDRFTRPEQLQVSIILLQVPPSSGQDVWDEAEAEADLILQRIRDGADFAEEARQHSDDPTAGRGGDMGFVHKGELGPDIQVVLDALQPGETASAPVRVLEGMVVTRLDDRRPEALIPFDDARDQALSLYRREASERAYTESVERLRAASEIWIDQDYLEAVGR